SQYLPGAGQAGEKLALLLVDLERLRGVNDSLGRRAGDELLKAFASRLEGGADRGEIGRISADHFAVVLRGVKGRSEVMRRVERLWRACFAEPYGFEGQSIKLSGRSGISLFPKDGRDGETLIRNAEAALRRAKGSGERHVYHAAEMTRDAAEK